MPLRLRCPHCQEIFEADDASRGRTIHCRACQKPMAVPAPAAPPRAVPPPLNAPKPAAPRAAAPSPIEDRRPPSGVRRGASPEPAPRPRREADEDRPSRRRRDDEDRAPRSRREYEDDRPSRRREDDEGRPSRPRRPQKASRSRAVWFVGGGVAALVLVIAGGVWALNRGRNTGPAGDAVQAKLDAVKADVPAGPPKAPANQDPPDKAEAQQPPPDGPVPDALSARDLDRVKQATVLLQVTTADGDRAEGSGFFALKAGLIITNAHVLGMLAKQSKYPRAVEVVVHSGRANEARLKGSVLGVDRANDLGIVFVAGDALPAPLPIETKRELVETQKVYIFGFPFGARLGRDITVSESSVSSLRNHGTDQVQQIQVNGGIHPGNSGGPVVNSGGQVVGVSVSVVRGTQINFAIPAHFVSGLATGRVADGQMGEAFTQDGKIFLPVRFSCLDPLNQVKEMRLEAWAGPPGPPLSPSAQQPKARPGDGQRQTVNLTYQDGVGRADAGLPTIPAGQVGWLQPVLVTADGKSRWGPPLATPEKLLPVERKPAKFAANFTEVPERTVRLKSVSSMTFTSGKLSEVDADKIDVDLLEVVEVGPEHVYQKIGYGPTTRIVSEVDGRPVKMHPETHKMLRALPPNFIILPASGGLKSRVSRNVNPKLPITLRKDFQGCFTQVCSSLEAVMLPIPNNTLAPQGKFTTNIALLLGGPDISGQQKSGTVTAKTIDLQLVCTHEGTRTRNEREEAVVSVVGRVKGRSKGTEGAKGDVTGKFGIDLAGGFVSFGQLKITTEIEAPGGEFRLTYALDVDLERRPGNPLNIQLPPERTAPKK